ncbi:dynein regulatory complex protein 9 [Leptopilina heterotoma]|uniref:dynein regulatory complex protein 9 n=1 Tax=Leptopilina heterotoma TaxID=63436 RepID=UPI001CA7E61B|nr:dynein regulatory complex protein 9 [Leptopilina heterotoma]
MESEFSVLEHGAILSALEECTDALAIYQYTLKKPSVHIGIDIDCIPPEVRYSKKIQQNGNNNSNNVVENFIEQRAIFDKLQRDGLYIERLVTETKKIFHKNGYLDMLIDEVEKEESRKSREEFLLTESLQLEKELSSLCQIRDGEILTNKEEAESLQQKLLDRKREMNEMTSKAHVELNYITAWKKTQCQQSILRGNITLKSLNLAQRECIILKENERRVTENIEAFLLQNLAANEKQSVHRKQRHVKESTMYEDEIRQLRNEIEIRRSVLEDLKREYDSRQAFIDTYLAEKEAIRKQKEHEEHVRRSAIKIQAWWRGVMVRRKLGPYRPEDKKKRSTKIKK